MNYFSTKNPSSQYVPEGEDFAHFPFSTVSQNINRSGLLRKPLQMDARFALFRLSQKRAAWNIADR